LLQMLVRDHRIARFRPSVNAVKQLRLLVQIET
jgi:hypothetical protein